MRNQEGNRIVNFACAAVVLAASAHAFAGDVIPFFRPDPKPVMYGPDLPHPIATECSVRDRKCIEEHDYRALSTALMLRDRTVCLDHSDATACEEVYDLVVDDAVPAWKAVVRAGR